MKKLLLLAVAVSIGLTACPSSQEQAQNQAVDRAQNRSYYIPKHDVEYNNYQRRARLADDPSAIIWCTSAFPIPSSPLFTVPVVGKLTSSFKRPFPNDPGPDGMYGQSDPYRYGFEPNGAYAEWNAVMPTFCTNEPTVWQRDSTTLVLQTDPVLLAAEQQAQKLLRAGKASEANQVLQQAIDKSGKP